MSVAWKGLHTAPVALSEKIPTRVCSVIDDPYFDEHPSDTEESDTSVILYEDKFVRVSVICASSPKRVDFSAFSTLFIPEMLLFPEWEGKTSGY